MTTDKDLRRWLIVLQAQVDMLQASVDALTTKYNAEYEFSIEKAIESAAAGNLVGAAHWLSEADQARGGTAI